MPADNSLIVRLSVLRLAQLVVGNANNNFNHREGERSSEAFLSLPRIEREREEAKNKDQITSAYV